MIRIDGIALANYLSATTASGRKGTSHDRRELIDRLNAEASVLVSPPSWLETPNAEEVAYLGLKHDSQEMLFPLILDTGFEEAESLLIEHMVLKQMPKTLHSLADLAMVNDQRWHDGGNV